MCTLTWLYSPGQYEIHFNRDESRKRSQATPPQIISRNQVDIISPTDPEGGGTWISVNQYGLAICLLNNYIEIKGSGGYLSRGRLVKALWENKNTKSASDHFSQIDVTAFNPFDLFIFDPEQRVKRFSWDGERLLISTPSIGFMTSSGFNAKEVIAGRFKQYQSLKEKNSASLEVFHRSHMPSKSAYSACMHRDDAATQSYSKIQVNQNESSFWYTDGPPCSTPPIAPIRINRT